MDVETLGAVLAATGDAGGATMAGVAIAIWLSRDPAKPLTGPAVGFLGAGIGAGLNYLVGWLEPLKAALAASLT